METAANAECELEIAELKGRPDYSPAFERPLEILRLANFPGKFKERFRKPVAGLACVQVPLELIDAAGFHPFRLRCGSLAVQGATAGRLPFLACPAIKSCVGHFHDGDSVERDCELLVIPSACDWTVKLPEMIMDAPDGRLHIMDLPHFRGRESSRERWFEETLALKRTLEKRSGSRIAAKTLRNSVAKYAEAWSVLNELAGLRYRSKLSGLWFIVLANAFLIDDAEVWTESACAAVKELEKAAESDAPPVLLTGSPVFFPNLKVPRLIEQSGMRIASDELCSSGRILSGLPVSCDTSMEGQLRALSERHLLACHCPTFSDNDRRIPSIIDEMKRHGIRGAVCHILKGCHPYDIESVRLERAVRDAGLHFIKIETDYSKEDVGSIRVRLEAFKDAIDS